MSYTCSITDEDFKSETYIDKPFITIFLKTGNSPLFVHFFYYLINQAAFHSPVDTHVLRLSVVCLKSGHYALCMELN